MNLSFDERGYLQPFDKIETDLITFKTFFVKAFSENSTRHQIFKAYEKFLIEFQTQVRKNFIQWISGSFVSKKENPGDIDFVTIIDFEIFETKEKFRLKGAKRLYGVDAYTIKKYPENHDRCIIYQHELVYWINWFGCVKKCMILEN